MEADREINFKKGNNKIKKLFLENLTRLKIGWRRAKVETGRTGEAFNNNQGETCT